MTNKLEELLAGADPELLSSSRDVFVRVTREQEGRLLQVVAWLEEELPATERITFALATRLALVRGLQRYKHRHAGSDRRMVFIGRPLLLEMYMTQSRALWESSVLDEGLADLEEWIERSGTVIREEDD